MGGMLSQLWWSGNPDVVNPESGLTRREIYAVQKSWIPVYANNVAVGSELLKRYFRAYPEGKQFFRMIKDLNEEQYDSNIQFRAHVISLMTSLNLAVNTLNQPEVVAVLMKKLGESHAKRKIQKKDFQDLKGVIVKMFIEVLKLDDATLGAWVKTIEFWYKNIFETLTTAESQS
ncbi:myoglobin-like [Maniola jurtina]|uniref:myoglobin-like n=1 Tax=Maniola jurtina TaxID=191418 RepID=UPI001E68B04D|nr:myoglobin-like [Maniola jurtina]XP_045771915.1 myoglobin-like [Maniola jurtina]